MPGRPPARTLSSLRGPPAARAAAHPLPSARGGPASRASSARTPSPLHPFRSTPVSLREQIADRSARLAVLGLGSVGLPLSAVFARAGFRVLGFDVDPERVARIQRGERVLSHLGHGLVSELVGSGRFEATADPARLAEATVKLICVPTPLGEYREPDLSYIEGAARTIGQHLAPGDLVVLESTTYPSTTRGVVGPILERASGLVAGRDFHLAFSPEREDPGRKDFDTRTIPKLVGGIDPASGALARALYAAAVDEVLEVSSAEVAEAAKLLENIFRAVNIALVNELKVVLDAMAIDVWEVIEAAATKPFGFMKFTPGPGMGGHCIPIDPFYLTWIARRFGHNSKFIELAGEINRRMPQYVVERTQAALNERGLAMKGARILVLGLAFKPDVDIVTESPSVELMKLFHRAGAHVEYADPFVPAATDDLPPELRGRRAVALDAATVAGFDALVLATHHSCFDYDLVAAHARLVVDTRNALASRMAGRPEYYKA